MRAPRAFSLVELLTALVLLAVGLAAYARAATAVARLENDARLRRAVAAAAIARLDTVGRVPCGTSVEGSARQQGVSERWRVAPEGSHLALVDLIDVASRPSFGRTITATVACLP